MESLRHFYSIIKNTNLLGTFYIFIFLSFISTFLEILSIGSILPLLKVIVDENFFDKYPYFQNLVNLLSPLQFFKISSSIHTNSIAGLSVFILLVFFIRFIFQVFIEYKKADFIHNLEFLLSNKLYNNLMNSNFIFHLNENSSNFHTK